MASLGTLAAGVAHEINNPLSFVTANLEFAQHELDALSRQIPSRTPHLQLAQQALSDARDGAERVRLIVGDLKHFSRGDDEQIRPVDVHEILEKTLTLAQNQIRHRAKVIRQFGEIPMVKGNAARLGQVFLNLIINAAQAIPEGTASENRILLSTDTSVDGKVVVKVKDSGKGIAPEVLERIFDPFFTTKPVGEGMGLGLPICHGIVSGLGGEIHVSSKPGQGTEVEVRLPPTHSSERMKPRATDTHTPTRGVPACMPCRGCVAVIDDEPLIGDIVRRALASEHDVAVYVSGRDVLVEIAEGRRSFDVILCDLMMPDVTGMDMYEALMKRSPEHARRMVFMTGGAFTPQAQNFVDEVDNVLIEKPFDLRGLKTLIRDLVKARAEAHGQ
jgi:two-component system, cell cycle sensor histidine kinase and response regulator CckA